MNSAVGTESLVFHKRAFVAALTGVFCQGRTLRTKTFFRTVTFFTVKANHQGDNSFFLFTLLFNALLHRFRLLIDWIPILQKLAA